MNTEPYILATMKKCGYQLATCTDADADYVATPPDGGDKFKLQISSGFVISERNRKRRNIRIALHDGESVYCYPHNGVLEQIERTHGPNGKILGSRSWQFFGFYFISPQRRQTGEYFAHWLAKLLAPHRIPRKG